MRRHAHRFYHEKTTSIKHEPKKKMGENMRGGKRVKVVDVINSKDDGKSGNQKREKLLPVDWRAR